MEERRENRDARGDLWFMVPLKWEQGVSKVPENINENSRIYFIALRNDGLTVEKYEEYNFFRAIHQL